MTTWTNWLISYGLGAPWHLALLIASVVIAWRCQNRRAAQLALIGLVLLFITSLVAHGLILALMSIGVLVRGDEALIRISTIVGYAELYGKALGLLLLVLAAFVGRPVTASR